MKLFLKHCIVLLLGSLLIANDLSAEPNNPDSLIKVLNNPSLNNSQRINILISINDAYEKLDKFAHGKPFLDTALQIALSNGDKESYADVKVGLGRYYLMTDNHAEAQRVLFEALQTYKTEQKIGKASVPLKYLGVIYYEKKNFTQAISYYDEAIEKANMGNSPVAAFTSRYLKALALTELGKLNEAYAIFKTILNQPDSITPLQRRMETLVGIGDIFIKQHFDDSAIFYYNAAYNYFDNNNNISAIPYAGVKLAETYLQQNKIDLALSIAIRCYNIADSVSLLELKYSSSKVISDAYLKKNNFKEAYYFLNIYDSLRAIVYNEESAKNLYNFRVKSQQEEIQGSRKDADKQRILKNAYFMGFMLATLLLIVSLISIAQNRRKNRALKKSNLEVQQTFNQLQATQEQLMRQEKLASLGRMVAGIAHEMQNPLNFVNNFSEVSVQLAKEYEKADAEERTQLLHEIVENLIRIRDHGIRASGIVRSMLLYSRNESFEKQQTDINNMLTDFIPLAYEGLHSTNPNFSCQIEKKFAELPLILCSPQDISRVFLNLLTNAFYTVNEKKKASNEYYLPVVTVTTKVIEGGIRILVHDNGIGIPERVREKIFEPFFTTKPSGKGTGLGLSLSYDIIKAHGGMLNVDSKVGIFTEFTITLPMS